MKKLIILAPLNVSLQKAPGGLTRSDKNTCRHLKHFVGVWVKLSRGLHTNHNNSAFHRNWRHLRFIIGALVVRSQSRFCYFSNLHRILSERELEIRTRTNTASLTQSLRSSIISHLRNPKLWSRFTRCRIFPAQRREGSIVCGRVLLLELKNAGTRVQLQNLLAAFGNTPHCDRLVNN